MSRMGQGDARRRLSIGFGSDRAPSRLRAGVMGLVLAGGLAGCASGEEVFLRQNQASAALAYAIMDIEMSQPEAVEPLYSAELELSEACAPLQEAGAKGMRREEIDIGLRLEILEALDQCAQVCHEVEMLVWQVDPEIARTYLDVSVLAEVSAQ